MSVEEPGPGEDFTARVIMQLPGAVPLRWANTYELSTNVGSDFTAWQPFADALANFHLAMLQSPFLVESVVISTLVADSAPYNPSNLAVFDYAQHGQRANVSGDNIYALNNCLLVKRLVPVGRHGNLLLRGFLTEADVTSTGGIVELTSISGCESIMQDALSASGLSGYYGTAAENIQLYMITAGLIDNVERVITDFRVKGLTSKKLNNKYFNRG
jgi:hypothetical protein